MAGKDYLILTDSIEKFEKAEEAYKNLDENYALDKSGLHGKMVIELNPLSDIKNYKGNVRIYPQYKHGEIGGIERRSSDSEGNIVKSDSEGWIVQIRDWSYLISKKRSENI